MRNRAALSKGFSSWHTILSKLFAQGKSQKKNTPIRALERCGPRTSSCSERAELQGEAPLLPQVSWAGPASTLPVPYSATGGLRPSGHPVTSIQRSADSESPHWALGRAGPSQVLNNKQKRNTFCTFPVRPGNIWAVGAIVTVRVGLKRQTGSVRNLEYSRGAGKRATCPGPASPGLVPTMHRAASCLCLQL